MCILAWLRSLLKVKFLVGFGEKSKCSRARQKVHVLQPTNIVAVVDIRSKGDPEFEFVEKRA